MTPEEALQHEWILDVSHLCSNLTTYMIFTLIHFSRGTMGVQEPSHVFLSPQVLDTAPPFIAHTHT